MKRVLLIILSLGFVLSSYTQPVEGESIGSNTTKEEQDNDNQILVNDDFIQAWEQSSLDKQFADKDLYKLEAFTRLKGGEDQFSYYILKELSWGDSFKSYLIYEEYESENAIWLANYTKNHTLIDAVEVYYDNAEGAWSTTSIINLKEHSLELTKYDAYADPDQTLQRVKITSNGKIEK